MYKILKYILIIIISFTWGYFSHRNNFFPGNFIKKIFSSEFITIFKYNLYEKTKNENSSLKPLILRYYNQNQFIFTNRSYTNSLITDKYIKGYTLIQMPRHFKKNIKFKILKPITIYRVLCDLNDNEFYNNWEIANFSLDIVGTKSFCTHKKVVKKHFLPQNLILPSGGPISSDPIFVDEKIKYNTKFFIY